MTTTSTTKRWSLVVLFAILFVSLIQPSHGQFGMPKATEEEEGAAAAADPMDTGGETVKSVLTEQEEIDIAAILKEARADLETMNMVRKMKEEMGKELGELEQLSKVEVLGALKVSLQELKGLDYLFQDHERALVEMDKEGLIAPEHLQKYQKDPSLLELDTRRAVYFQFIAIAVVAGFIEP
eukprot:CAMPEP_0118696216 /NCGR_PEP_ID=MMETSP0800-20121206/13705_1 /TAXON_ID=210618 ORGANISM="Striatella unipunctata, Strain CCMP2910" /NCGR_SAMPLE_ID=MMETSP0800 /ASSEMBLY_ACC=CAM_ASM_000638 /LENGTH=181 /DNA_ID=CAMNT_0006595267 /DNA_START=50 /DNA_END=595 /DNA_ORIENTATION=+